MDGGERPCHECVHVCACVWLWSQWKGLGVPLRSCLPHYFETSVSHCPGVLFLFPPPIVGLKHMPLCLDFFFKYGFWRVNSGSNICKSSILLNELCPQAPNSNFYYIKTNVKNSLRIITVVETKALVVVIVL